MVFLLFTNSNQENQVTMAWNAIFLYKLGKKNLKIGQPSNIDVLKEGDIRLYFLTGQQKHSHFKNSWKIIQSYECMWLPQWIKHLEKFLMNLNQKIIESPGSWILLRIHKIISRFYEWWICGASRVLPW